MKHRNAKRVLLWAGLLLLSALLVLSLALTGMVSFIVSSSHATNSWNASLDRISEALEREGASGYTFLEEAYLKEKSLWAMLIDETGNVVWQIGKPDEVPEHYTLKDVASFTRWYLEDYPVQVRVRPDGLLVVGSPKNSTWKYSFAMDTSVLNRAPGWFLLFFLAALAGVLALSSYWVGKRFRREQQDRDAARSDWINGVSHDIRTPLSVVMGYAGQIEQDEALPEHRREQAAVIRRQSQTIRDLVNDLNLTMRLDCEMQALRKEPTSPAALIRQAAADFLNGGMAGGFSIEVDLPEQPLPDVTADPFLLRRALNNLLTNAVRHNQPGCVIRLGARREPGWCVLWVESGAPSEGAAAGRTVNQLEEDGGAAHGTGLKLVRQIALSHGGKVQFFSGTTFCSEIYLPETGRV